MKHNKLANALNEISDRHISEAAAPKKKHTWHWVSALAAVLVVAITLTIIPWRLPSEETPMKPESTKPAFTDAESFTEAPGALPALPITADSLVASPQYPRMEPYPMDFENWDLYSAWVDSQQQQYDQPRGFGDNLADFYAKSIPLFLSSETENAVYSPANVYMALAMLAETAGGQTRQQILSALNAQSMEDLRTQAGYMWNAHYCNDNATTLLLGNSLWLDDTLSYNSETAKTLADSYYASTYHGDLSSQELSADLRQWLNANTGDLLREQVEDMAFDSQTLMALASTIYYKAKWSSEFNAQYNTEDVFHSPSGDKTVTYMKQDLYYGPYYYGEGYSATSLRLGDGSRMWLILPDEGLTPQDILEQGNALNDLLISGEPQNFSSIIVHLQIPKFDIASDTELSKGLQELGLTDLFDPEKADFSGISSDPLYVTQADHAARVKIDETGLEAASYMVMQAAGAGQPPEEEIDFVLDRPFLFVVESSSGTPLFTGVVNEP